MFSESENTTTASSSRKSGSSSKTSSEKISINESSRSSIRDSLSSSEAATKVSHEYSNGVSINLDVSANNNHQQNEISTGNSLNTSSSSIITNTSIAVNEEHKVTTNQLSKDLSIKIQSHPEATINDFTLKWPKFEVKNVLFKATDQKPKDLFGSVDELVFSFLKNQQRHSNEILCSRPDCPKKERKCTSTELDIFSTDEHIDKCEIESEGVCPVMVKRREEMCEAKALQKKYKDGRVPLFNCETNTNECERGWVCNARNIQTSAIFDYGFPPIII
ncbi:unnamed protein product, partial [Rotaria sordida]